MIVRVCDRCRKIIRTYNYKVIVVIKEKEFDICNDCLNDLKIKLEKGGDNDDENAL